MKKEKESAKMTARHFSLWRLFLIYYMNLG